MSLLTQAYLLEKYGLRLNLEQVAEALGLHPGTVRNLISSGELGIRTYIERGRRWASIEAVAEYFDMLNELSKQARKGEPPPEFPLK